MQEYDFSIEFDHNEEKLHAFSYDNPKRRFVESRWERLKINKYIQAIKKGWMKTLA